MSVKLDAIDRKILQIIQENARITNADLAAQVGLSPTPCLRRLRRLEQKRVIAGYYAELDREIMGVNVTALILVKLEREDESTMNDFESTITARPEVMECSLVTGKFDYFVRVLVGSLSAYESFLSETLLRMPNVETVESSFVLREVARRASLPAFDDA
ncbi:MAG: Lrp/AsnC family transcriptional regulator [Pseudomonadota bacterium]